MPTLRLRDAELHYEDRGRGEPVVFLHGLGSSSADWEAQLESLAPRYRAIAIDMRGSGASTDLLHPHGPFTVAGFAADVAGVIEQLGIGPAHVVGLSMGGMIAFQLAVDHPRVVHTLAIINSAPSLVPRTWQEHAGILTRIVVANTCGPKAMARMLAPSLFPHAEHTRAMFLERMARNRRRAYAATQGALIGFDVTDRIGAITAPTLIVASDQDYTPLSRKHEYAAVMQDARVVEVPDSRHALPIEAPEKLQPILDAFLAEHTMTHDKGGNRVASR